MTLCVGCCTTVMRDGAGCVLKEVSQRKIDFKRQARSQFDDWANAYDRSILHHFLFRPGYMMLMEEMARWRLSHAGPFDLLDIGCGTGEMAGILAAACWPVTYIGLDYSPSMCATATEKARAGGCPNRVIFVGGDSEHLPLADACVEFVICANSFHHYPHQQAVVSEVYRILKPGGRFILVDGFRDNALGWFVFDVAITYIEKSVYHAPWHVMDRYFNTAGFTNISRRKSSILFPLLATIGDK